MPDITENFSSRNNLPDTYNQKAVTPKEFVLRHLKYIPWIVLCVIIGLIIGYVKIRYTTPIYHVQSSMLINNEQGSSAGDQRLGQLFMGQGTSNLSNEIQILRSRPVLQRVAKKLGLQMTCYNVGKIRTSLCYPEGPVKLNILSLRDSSGGFSFDITVLNTRQFVIGKNVKTQAFGEVFDIGGNHCSLTLNQNISLKEYSSPEFAISYQTVASAASGLIGGLKVSQGTDQSTILNLSFETENTRLGKDVLNTLMSVYDGLIVEDKKVTANNTLSFINDRLDSLQRDLSKTEQGIKGFREQQQVFDVEGQSRSYLDDITLNGKVSNEAAVKMSILNYLENYLADNKNAFQLVPNNLGIDDPTLLQLTTEYNKVVLERTLNLKTTPSNNPMILGMETTLEKLRENMIEALKNTKQRYLISQNSVQNQAQQLQGQLRSMPGKSMQLVSIQRKQKIYEDLFSFLLQKSIETSISSASTISNSKVIEPALASGNPVSPDTGSIYSFYVLLGLVIPVGMITVTELMKDKIINRGDVERRTRAPILGEIGHSSDKQQLVVTKNSRRFIAEQFRIIRSNMQYITNKKENPTIMVTSSFSGEGKSFVSTNIGAVMSLAGKKTVIMEFDIRKPKIVVGLELKRNMGITNYIIGRASFEELPLQVPGMDNLYVIPCGPIPPNPAELLLDSKLAELITLAKANFDVVIMDTAPVGLVSDAATLGKFADCTLYIIRQGHTYRKQMELIEELYVNQKLPSIALLLNDVKIEGGRYGGYGYGGYGYGGYGYGGYGYGSESGYFEDEPKRKRSGPFRKIKRFFKRFFN